MQTLIDFFNIKGLIPHGFCLSWSPLLLWMNILSDALIALSYYSIPLMVFYFIKKRKDLPYPWLFIMTSLFIVACGTTHLLSIITLWIPIYWLDGIVKTITSLVSLATAIAMIWIIPKALQLPSTAELQAEIKERQKAQESLQINEMRFYMMFENTLNGIAIYKALEQGDDFMFETINQAGETIERRSKEMLLGKRISEVFPNNLSGDLFKTMQRVYKTGNSEHIIASTYQEDPLGHFREYYIYKLPSEELVCVYADVTERKRAEICLEKEKQLSIDIINSLPGIFYMLDSEGYLIQWNNQFLDVSGYSIEDIKGHHALDFIRESDKDMIAEKIQDAFEKGSAFAKAEFKTKQGIEIPYYFSAKRIVLDGKIHLIGLGSDISELNQTQEALLEKENLLSLARQFTPFGLWSLNLYTGKYAWDDTMFDIYQLKEFHGHFDEWKKCVHPEDIDHVETLFQKALESGESFNAEFRIINPDGKIKYIGARSEALKDHKGHLEKIIGTNTDITELKRTQELAEETAKMKSNFLANMSHEIRTPMNAIVGFSQLALNCEVEPKVKDYLNKIENASQNLLQIINDILDLSKSEAGRIALERIHFNLKNLVNYLHMLFAIQAEEKELLFEIKIDSDVPIDLIGDQLRLQQILANLLGNAIKFTPKGSVKLEIKLKRLDSFQACLSFSVQDTGIGMSEKECSRLFQIFNQADSSISRRFGGTGLGLAISRNLLHLMGGEFEVKSIPGHGSTFSFELTLERSHQIFKPLETIIPPKLSSSLNQKLSGVHILIAEDDLTNQIVTTELLKIAGATSELAKNGIEALEILEKAHFDMILMDVHMPIMDGIEATKKIRKIERFTKLPIIALTAGVTSEERANCLASGMNDFLTKPIDSKQLIKTLSQWLAAKPIKLINRSNPLDLPGFDLNPLIEILDGKTDKLTKILREFREDFIDLLEKIEIDLAQANFSEVKTKIHTLKGASGNIGATHLYECAIELENGLHLNRLEPEVYERFCRTFHQAMQSLSQLSLTEKRPGSPISDSNAYKKSLKEIDALLSKHDFVEDELLDKLNALLPEEKKESFHKLRQHIDSIRYADARALLKLMDETI